jgi:hypothetical protein
MLPKSSPLSKSLIQPTDLIGTRQASQQKCRKKPHFYTPRALSALTPPPPVLPSTSPTACGPSHTRGRLLPHSSPTYHLTPSLTQLTHPSRRTPSLQCYRGEGRYEKNGVSPSTATQQVTVNSSYTGVALLRDARRTSQRILVEIGRHLPGTSPRRRAQAHFPALIRSPITCPRHHRRDCSRVICVPLRLKSPAVLPIFLATHHSATEDT